VPCLFLWVSDTGQCPKLDYASLRPELDLLDCASEVGFPRLDYASPGWSLFVCIAVVFITTDWFTSRIAVIEIDTCECSPAALQPTLCGFFLCAPIAPTLAVSLQMLEFVCELFVRMPPNTTSWCDTLEIFLGKRSYKLTTRVGSITFNQFHFLIVQPGHFTA